MSRNDGSPPRLAAYVMAADPSWIEESVLSYYGLVERIVVSYDVSGISWTGTRMPVEESLERLRAIDTEGKLDFVPGDHFVPGRHPLESDTRQRRAALAEAGRDVDWVLQLDTDEVVADRTAFLEALVEAHRLGFRALEYPARVLYQHVRDDLYLEYSNRFWGLAANYPGPVAVRSDAELTLARQGESHIYRVDFRARNTDPAHHSDAPVHHVVRADQGIWHYSKVRSDEDMLAKSRASGHAHDYDWDDLIVRWRARREHPWRAVLGTPVRHGQDRRFLRLVRVPGAPDAASRRRNRLAG